MLLCDYLKHVISQHLGGDRTRFDELWELVPRFSAELRSFNSVKEWLHWYPQTFDGWYCVPNEGEYIVYYQERGIRSEPVRFGSECQAVRYAIDSAVLPLAT